jgi:hypothetical protein
MVCVRRDGSYVWDEQRTLFIMPFIFLCVLSPFSLFAVLLSFRSLVGLKYYVSLPVYLW